MEYNINGLLMVNLEDIRDDGLNLLISECNKELAERKNKKREKLIDNFLDALNKLKEDGCYPYVDLYGIDTEESYYLEEQNIYFD